MNEIVLLTGGRGFFGRRILDALRRHGHEVSAPGRPDFDLLDADSVRAAVREVRPATLVHSAAYYGGLGICMAEPVNLFDRNTRMTLNLLAAAGAAGVRRFVSVGSSCAYPGDVPGEMSEDDYWCGRLHPSVEAYGFSKKIQEVGVRAYGRETGLRGQFPVITNLYGEHDVFTERRSHVVAALIRKFVEAVQAGEDRVECWGTGTPVREFLYVGDAAEGIARLMETEYGEPLNIGTGVGTSIRELADLVGRITGFTGEIRWSGEAGGSESRGSESRGSESRASESRDGVARKVLDVGRMRERLGWSPPTGLEEGLRRTIDWYVANKEEADARE